MRLPKQIKKPINRILQDIYPITSHLEAKLQILNSRSRSLNRCSYLPKDILDIRNISLNYIDNMRITNDGRFIGYRHSVNTTKPILYDTLAALLVKHLYGVNDEKIKEEIEYLLQFQNDDGLFRDPVIDCKSAEIEDWWGWRHLTLHVLMTLAIYNVSTRKEIGYIKRFADKDRFYRYVNTRNWNERAAWTSNELQNIGVMLQYSRDYQNWQIADSLMEILYEALDDRQDSLTGLYGHRFETQMELSLGVQAGYHFWLLYFYDNRPIHHIERIIDSILKTQNIFGGYSARWNSSACEDIDSIDPLMRLSKLTDYRRDDIQMSLQKALLSILYNLNSDGGWVFRRHESLKIVHRQMFSAINESNMFYTWFRTLGLAYCLIGLNDVPAEMKYDWNFTHAPGLQFI